MLTFSGIEVFVKTAETLNFTEAGQRLGISSSAVGKSISRLEDRLGVQLFRRSTRTVALTEKGESYLSFCRKALEAMEEGEQLLGESQNIPAGKLRIGMPLVCSPFQETFMKFLKKYPQIQLELDFSDRLVDVVEEGFDLVVRTGKLMDSRLMSKYLGQCKMQLVAAPSYLDRAVRPNAAEDLIDLACLQFRASANGRLLKWPVPPNIANQLSSQLTCSHVEMLYYAARQGAGVAYLPDFLTHRDVQNGALEIVLEDQAHSTTDFHLIWPPSNWRPRKLSLAIEFLSSNLLSAPN